MVKPKLDLPTHEDVAREKAAKEPEKLERKEGRDELGLVYHGRKIQTVEQLLEDTGVDLAIWEVASQVINTWEVGGKKKNGRGLPESLWAMPLRQIKVTLRRRAPKPVQDAIRELLNRPLPKLPPVKHAKGSTHLLEVSLYDAHLGKLCWGKHTGTPYDLALASAVYCHAVDDLLDRVKGFDVGRILLPIGNDFFHVDNWTGTTARGTAVDSTDDRFQKVFRVGCEAVEFAVRRLREVAPVEIIWIPGNHDPATSWYLVEWLAAVFREDKAVSIDNSPPERKYRSWGPALIGFTHGDNPKLDRLPLLMPVEAPEAWAASKERAWHVGHYHKKAETRHTAGDTHAGVAVTVLPSLSGTDAWHYQQGWVGTQRRAEAYLWSQDNGYVGHFSVMARA